MWGFRMSHNPVRFGDEAFKRDKKMRYFTPKEDDQDYSNRPVYMLPDDLCGKFEIIGELTELGFFILENDEMKRVVGDLSMFGQNVWIEHYKEIKDKELIEQFEM